MDQQVYWHAALWEVLLVASVTLACLIWLVRRALRRPDSREALMAIDPALNDWYPLFPSPVLAEAALDRLINRSHHLILEGRSYRPLLRPDPVPSLAKENGPEQDQSEPHTKSG